LHATHEGRLQLLCGIPNEAPPEPLAGALERYMKRELEQDTVTAIEEITSAPAIGAFTLDTGTGTASVTAMPVPPVLTHPSGLRMYPLLLELHSAGERTIAGIATIAVRDDGFVAPPRALLEIVAAALLENDDVDAVTRVL
jgi:hypothetical protein